jgi:CheY-like chemotaxis protein
MPTMAPSSAEAAKRLVILVVEDDEADAYLIQRALARHANVATVVQAPDGVEALRMVESREVEPDLAFIDLHMPRKNGFNLLAAIAAGSAPRFPMVVLTSSTAPTDAMRSRLRGAVRVVTKPDTLQAMEVELGRAIAAVRPQAGKPAAKAAPPPADLRRPFPGIRGAAIDERAPGPLPRN